MASIPGPGRRAARSSSSDIRSHRCGSIASGPGSGCSASLKEVPRGRGGRRHTLPLERVAESNRAPPRRRIELLRETEEQIETPLLLGAEVVVDVRPQVGLDRFGGKTKSPA